MLIKHTGMLRKGGKEMTVPVFCRKCGRAIKQPKLAGKHFNCDRMGSGQPIYGLNICSSCMRK